MVDTATAAAALDGINTVVEPPVEPHVELTGEGARLVGAENGIGIDTSVILAGLAGAVAQGTNPIVIEIDYESLPPATDETDYAELFAEVDRLRTTPVQVTLNDFVGSIEPAEVTKWMSLAGSSVDTAVVLDAAMAQTALEAVLEPAKSGGGPPEFAVENGAVAIVDSEGGTVCCGPEAGAALTAAMLDSAPQPIAVPGRPRTPEEGLAEAQALGIKEEVASFTTEHSCCQSRVTNIHLFADMVRGDVILPGESYSLNAAVGERTAEKGFVEGGFIQNGVLTTASAAASASSPPRSSTPPSSPGSTTTSTRPTRSTSAATRTDARPPSRGTTPTSWSATPRRTGSSCGRATPTRRSR